MIVRRAVKVTRKHTDTHRHTHNCSPHSQIHGPNCEQGEGVDLYHDGHEGDVQEHFDEAWNGKTYI